MRRRMRKSRSLSRASTTSPSKRTVPALAACTPPIRRSSVVLPQPEPPRMDVTLPRWKRSETSLRMVRLASYPNVTWSISIRVSALAFWGSLGIALVLFLSAWATGVRAGVASKAGGLSHGGSGLAGETRIRLVTSRHGRFRHRFWQCGQKKVERCACTMRRTGLPQTQAGLAARGRTPPRAAGSCRPCRARRGSRAACVPPRSSAWARMRRMAAASRSQRARLTRPAAVRGSMRASNSASQA